MKKAFISFLITTLMLTNISLINISSVQAATTNDGIETSTDATIKVSLENIRDIVIENNLDIKIQYNALQITNDQYHEAKDAYDAADKAYDAAVAAYDAAVATGDATAISNALNDKTIAKNNLSAEDDALTTKRDSNKSAKTTYDQQVESKVYAAQTNYIDYLTNLSSAKLQEDTIKSNEKEEQVYKLQYENGFISKNKYTSLLQDNVTPTNKLKETKDATEIARIKLCNSLGINPGKNVTINTDITEDFEVISKINYEDDLGKMLENKIDIKDQNDEIDDLKDEQDKNDDSDKDDYYDHMIEKANNNLKLLMNNAEESFKEEYNTLMNSYNTIKSSYDSLTIEKNTYSIMEIKHDYGFVSQKEVDDAKLTLDTDESALQTKKNTLYVNYLKYLQMKEGY